MRDYIVEFLEVTKACFKLLLMILVLFLVGASFVFPIWFAIRYENICWLLLWLTAPFFMVILVYISIWIGFDE